MARLNTNFMVLATFVMTGILVFSGTNNVVLGQGCQGDLQGLITQCAIYVQKAGPKMDPSQGCCNVIKTVDIPCVCQHITAEIERVIDIQKVVYVAQFCGRPLASGTKCGSKKRKIQVPSH
ncbi:Protease inhibitor/seed storage/lipid transfer family protein [Quillaja saponaria]|uniref:Protease inhibitor/seed storage/lipid transfer family protein n=1 Tax=Quillaja saponaria TaxID=32244 RepID=A0AAD7QJ12_QUISA|nr:Protease inhibitor/seed storage/lipid transfer family protein [Quillaja saponaria]